MPAESKAIRSTLVIRSFRHEDTDAIAQILQQSRHAANWSTQGLAALGTNAGERALVSEARGGVTGFLVGRQAAGRVGFFFHVEDFGVAYARMTSAGVQFLTAPRVEPYGRVAVFADIAGNKWDLIGPASQG